MQTSRLCEIDVSLCEAQYRMVDMVVVQEKEPVLTKYDPCIIGDATVGSIKHQAVVAHAAL